MALLCLAAMGFLYVAAEDAVTDLVRCPWTESRLVKLSSRSVSPTKEWLRGFSLNYVHTIEQSPLPSAVREALLCAQQPRACCSSDKSAVPPLAFPAEGTGNICFLFKFKGITLIDDRMQSWRWGGCLIVLPGLCSHGICYGLCEKSTFLSPASHQ